MGTVLMDYNNNPLEVRKFYCDMESGETLMVTDITKKELKTDYFSAKVISPIEIARRKTRNFFPLSDFELRDEARIDREHANWLEENLVS